jgi:hypothetical protein
MMSTFIFMVSGAWLLLVGVQTSEGTPDRCHAGGPLDPPGLV